MKLSLRAIAAGEVALVAILYIAGAQLAVETVQADTLLPSVLSPRERAIGGVFLVGALAQLAMIAIAAALLADVRAAAAATFRRANRPGWTIALIGAAIQVATVAFFFVPDASRIVEPSARNVVLSLIPASDGWSQEVLFRGYILFRLARAGFPVWLQVAVSAAAFAAIHIGYFGAGFWGLLWPLVGTASLGAVFAASVIAARGSLLPAVTGHVLVILLVQPWLALAS